jgi:HAD superfamily hydrolase (TIGR01509 family)
LPNPFAAVIFDMDGLMLDTERPSLQAWKQAAANRGFVLTNEICFRTIGVSEKSVRAVYNEVFGAGFPYDNLRQEVRAILAESEKNGVSLRPGLLVLLDRLAELNMPLGVATSTHKERALWKLEKAGIKERFTAFAFGDEVENGKPAPDIFLLAAQRLGKKPADCVGFEDSSAGLAGLYAAGIRSVFVKDLIEPEPEILALIWRRYTDLAEAVPIFTEV